ncbi:MULTISPECIES: TrkA family potassium uptake protein [Clostridium]|uniref:Ktr system potassium uptake protein A n=1 Tax=Clostridium ragsdalei P11 TaxID=1353534 RepID=A0A1A6B2K1_9CLOT|nr:MULTISPECIES: TrkA family potassium uptake protein [Clostridium]OBR96576.1 Ktr system potassium uptake protein A [Clostridium ragsdalei P11]QXE21183.1 potassium transporter Trk [Clostridium sp. 001]
MSKKQYIVLGLGKFGASVATTLYNLGNDVLAVDSKEEVVQEISPYVTQAMQTDISDEENLKSLGVNNFDAAIIGVGTNLQSSVIATLILKEMGVKYILAKANTEIQAKILYKIGADKVVFPERDTAFRVAHSLASENILELIELSSEYGITEIFAFEKWYDKTLKELNIRSKYGINIIAIKRNDSIYVSPKSDYKISKGDILIVIGKYNEIEDLK